MTRHAFSCWCLCSMWCTCNMRCRICALDDTAQTVSAWRIDSRAMDSVVCVLHVPTVEVISAPAHDSTSSSSINQNHLIILCTAPRMHPKKNPPRPRSFRHIPHARDSRQKVPIYTSNTPSPSLRLSFLFFSFFSTKKKNLSALEILLGCAVPPLLVHDICTRYHDLAGDGNEQEGGQIGFVATDDWAHMPR